MRPVISRTPCAALLATVLLAACASADPYEPLTHHTFTHDGVEREYFVHVPDNHEGALPVVLAIHGYTSTATGFAVFHDLRAHANEHGYIVVYPQGTHFVHREPEREYRVTSWNMLGDMQPDPAQGPQCLRDVTEYPCPPDCETCDRCQWASCGDDYGYFDRLLDEVAAQYATDTDRYYALGMSNGGMMTLGLGCNLSGRFAAIAPIDAQMPLGYGCVPGTRLPMMHLSGGRDNVVPPDGGPAEDGFLYVSAARTAADWADALACEDGPHDWETSRSLAAGLTCSAYSRCAIAGHEVVMCEDPEETHNWPARRPGGAWPTCVTSQQKDAMPEQRQCEARQEYGPHRGMDLIWEFFARYQRRSAGLR